jgi:hypothetical protein
LQKTLNIPNPDRLGIIFCSPDCKKHQKILQFGKLRH